jgi:uncharacterized protein YuzE
MTFKRLSLAFENCEVIDIPAEEVPYLRISGISTTQFYRNGEEVEVQTECQDCAIHITKAAGELEMPWECDGEPCTLAEHLQARDITSVQLDYDGRTDIYYVKWSDKYEWHNEWMEVADEGDEIHISIHQ